MTPALIERPSIVPADNQHDYLNSCLTTFLQSDQLYLLISTAYPLDTQKGTISTFMLAPVFFN
jgi:hypothetical protein